MPQSDQDQRLALAEYTNRPQIFILGIFTINASQRFVLWKIGT